MKKEDILDRWNTLAIRKIKINEHTQITVGRLVLMSVIFLFQILGMLCFNNWIWDASMFFAFGTFVGSLSKPEKEKEKD
jgi:hypothetical protein